MTRFFSNIDHLVLRSFHQATERPTRFLVKERYTMFMKVDEIDPMALNRVYRKLDRAWNQFMVKKE